MTSPTSTLSTWPMFTITPVQRHNVGNTLGAPEVAATRKRTRYSDLPPSHSFAPTQRNLSWTKIQGCLDFGRRERFQWIWSYFIYHNNEEFISEGVNQSNKMEGIFRRQKDESRRFQKYFSLELFKNIFHEFSGWFHYWIGPKMMIMMTMITTTMGPITISHVND